MRSIEKLYLLCRHLNRDDIIVNGLSSGEDAPLEVLPQGIAGRGVFATGLITKGSWLCEYKGLVYPLSDKPRYEVEYTKNNEGSYIIDSQYPLPGVGRLCWDATRRFHQLGRYLNHALHPNAALSKPFFVRGKWRIGFYAMRDIKPGHEVVWDYGVKGEEWSGCRLEDDVMMKGRREDKGVQVTFSEP